MDYIIYRKATNDFMCWADGQIFVTANEEEIKSQYAQEEIDNTNPQILKLTYCTNYLSATKTVCELALVKDEDDNVVGDFNYFPSDDEEKSFYTELTKWSVSYIEDMTKKEYTFDDITLMVKASKGTPVMRKEWGDKDYRNKYTITIINDGVEMKFAFYDCINNYNKGINNLGDNEINDALDCIFNDAIGYIENPTLFEFLNCFGYDCDDRAGKKAFMECGRTYNKLCKLGLNDDSICSIANSLRN